MSVILGQFDSEVLDLTDRHRHDSDIYKKEEGGVLQVLSFISGSEIQLHIFTVGE